MSYTSRVLTNAIKKNPYEMEFHQALTEVLPTLEPVCDACPEIEREGVLERLVEPERMLTFRIPWTNDKGEICVNRGYRVQFNSAIGPYKGGMRFHPTVCASIVKFLGFEQIFKNALTGLPIGGGKGGSDFDPKGKSDHEVMNFCQSLTNELYRHIGANIDVPAGDIGVGAREIGYMYGQFKKLTGLNVGVFTGKSLCYGGSLVRTEATGYGLIYILKRMLLDAKTGIKGKKIIISGSGNVALYAAEKAVREGATVIAMSDSGGYIHNPAGIDIKRIKDIKEKRRERIQKYCDIDKKTEFCADGKIWRLKCDVALPCATQNEIDGDDARTLFENGCIAVAEGSNMSSKPEAAHLFLQNGVAFVPGKAANAGGVAVSALEMSQNSIRMSWSFDEVDAKLEGIMNGIYDKITKTAEMYGKKNNLIAGANIAGFSDVAQAMIFQGAV